MTRKEKNTVESVDWSFVRYANCWEDADMLLQNLPKNPSHIFSIASGGDNSISLLLLDPELITAADINPSQLYLCELKICAIKKLEREEYLKFIGFRKETEENRAKVFTSIQPELSKEAQAYFQKHLAKIKSGIIHSGKFEHYFQIFSKKILPKIHKTKTIEELLKKKSASEQKSFYQNRWNTWRWKLFFKLFFSRPVMGKFGRDKKLFHEVKVNVSRFIKQQADTHLSSIRCQQNPFLEYTLLNEFRTLPGYLQAENYPIIQSRINRIRLVKGSISESQLKDKPFDILNLSNIFEYMSLSDFKTLSNELKKGLAPRAYLAYWNLMVPRNLSDTDVCFQNVSIPQNKLESDKGFFYANFIVNEYQTK